MNTTARAPKKRDQLTTVFFTNSLKGRMGRLWWLYLKNPKRAFLARINRGKVSDDAVKAADTLTEEGLFIADAATVLTPAGLAALQDSKKSILGKIESEQDSIRQILEGGKNPKNRNKDYLIDIVPRHVPIEADSPFLRLALDPALLELAASYFGMWPELHRISSWLNFPTPREASESQLWHRDPEDFKFLKVFIYLEDVGERNGPFTFIPRTHPFGVDSNIVPAHEHIRRITDDEMMTAFPKDRWVKCMGPANTMIIADTVGFHRGGKVDEGRRLLITFTYTSGKPQAARELKVSGNPSWASLPIQKAALGAIR